MKRAIITILCFTVYFPISVQLFAQSSERCISVKNIVFVEKFDEKKAVVRQEAFEEKELGIRCYAPRLDTDAIEALTLTLSTKYTIDRLKELDGNRILVRIWVNRNAKVEQSEYVFSRWNGREMFLSDEELYDLDKIVRGMDFPYNPEGSNRDDCEFAIFAIGFPYKRLLELKQQ